MVSFRGRPFPERVYLFETGTLPDGRAFWRVAMVLQDNQLFATTRTLFIVRLGVKADKRATEPGYKNCELANGRGSDATFSKTQGRYVCNDGFDIGAIQCNKY